MAGIGAIFSSALRGFVDGLQAGTEEGVRLEVERIREDERPQLELRLIRARVEAERVMAIDNERKETEKVEEEKKKKDERLRAEKQKERDDKTSFWTTPGLRPLAEPPILDWDLFLRYHIPSDIRYRALFPNDPEKRSRMKDIVGEMAALHEYTYCATILADDAELDGKRLEFYANLFEEVDRDLQDVHQDFDGVWEAASPLSRFEYLLLDNDGKTTGLEHWIEQGADIFYGQTDDVKEKYWHLVPHDFVENDHATMKFRFDKRDGIMGIGGRHLVKRRDDEILIAWAEDMYDKDASLRALLPHPSPFEPGTPTSVRSDHLPKADDISRCL